jgi:hypothetical protein
VSPGPAIALVLGLVLAAWILAFALLTGGLPHVRMWRPRIRVPARARRRLERRYDAAVHLLTRGADPRHVQAATEPFREMPA